MISTKTRTISLSIHKDSYHKYTVLICGLLLILYSSSAADIIKMLDLVEREAWGALPPKFYPRLESLAHPVPYVVLSYFIPSITDDVLALQVIQKKHMDAGLPDIQSNFLVGRNGSVYEGRGWKTKPAKSIDFPTYDGKFIEIAYIGNFNDEPLLHPIYNATWDIIKYGINKNFILEDFVILTEKHRKEAD